MRPISIYIHIPFCKRKCPYCTFFHVEHDEEEEDRFITSAVREIRSELSVLRTSSCSPDLSDEKIFLRSVYFGGGTPSLLKKQSVEKLFTELAAFIFKDLIEEITFELNPEDAGQGYLAFLKEMGVNRISLGIQSMASRAQKVLNRCSPEVNARSIRRVRSMFDNFNLDVLLGIPGAKKDEVFTTLKRLQEFKPPHLSVYCLEHDKNSTEGMQAFLKRVDQDQSAGEYLDACKYLKRLGYNHYEVSNFALPGLESVHNRVYWECGEYIGIGPAAHSMLEGKRFSNEASLDKYIEVDAVELRRAKTLDAVNEESQLLEKLMLGLRTDKGISIELLQCDPSVPEQLVEHKLAHMSGERLLLTDRGYLLLNEVVLRLAGKGADFLRSSDPG